MTSSLPILEINLRNSSVDDGLRTKEWTSTMCPANDPQCSSFPIIISFIVFPRLYEYLSAFLSVSKLILLPSMYALGISDCKGPVHGILGFGVIHRVIGYLVVVCGVSFFICL